MSKDIKELYTREREYERFVFGEYEDIESLNLASFLNFLDLYLARAKQAYAGKWENELPSWLISCKEFEEGGTAPIKVYEELIKVMTLAGAALETFANIDPTQWRINREEESKKWRE